MLIKCPECGKEISDKSPKCIHCGYPLDSKPVTELIDQPHICTILGEEHDLSNLDKLIKEKKYYQFFKESSKIKNGYYAKWNMKPINYLLRYVDEHNELPTEITEEDIRKNPPRTNIDLIKKWKRIEANPSGIVKCPKCGSTSITSGQRGFSLTTGFFGSNKTMNRCANCGYKWSPK